MEALTDRQRQILDFIREHLDLEQCTPTYREIGQHFGISSPNGVTCHVKALQKKGFIAMRGRRYTTRRIKLLSVH